MPADCPADKIINPATGRCVLKTGKIGRALLAAEQKPSRAKLAQSIRKHFTMATACAVKVKTTYTIKDGQGNTILTFNDKLGKGKTCVAYKHTVDNLPAFSSKAIETTTNELAAMESVSKDAERGMPNFPILYHVMACNSKPCPKPLCKTPHRQYAIMLSELADTTFENMVDHHAPTQEDVESMTAQVVLSLVAFHKRHHFVHNDAHLANLLVHRVAPGGYWVYTTKKHTIYVRNTGYIVVLWDYGHSQPIKPKTPRDAQHNDFQRFAGSFVYREDNLKHLAEYRTTVLKWYTEYDKLWQRSRELGDADELAIEAFANSLSKGGGGVVVMDKPLPKNTRVLNHFQIVVV